MRAKVAYASLLAVLVGVFGWVAVKADVGEKKLPRGPVDSSSAPYDALLPGVTRHVLSGDADKGEHEAFVRFAPGQDNGWHTHTHDVAIVVVRGAYVYEDEGGKKRVGPGCWFQVPGGLRHRSGGDPREGALFYNLFSGKFDLKPEGSAGPGGHRRRSE